MQVITVPSQATPTLVAAGGNREFIHIYNNSAATVFICYDLDSAAALAALTIANGLPIVSGGTLTLDNTGPRKIYDKPVYAVQQSGGAVELRIQGA
jgi:hypothetical protein